MNNEKNSLNRISDLLNIQYGIECSFIDRQTGGWSAFAYKVSADKTTYFLKVYDKSRASTNRLTELIDTYVPITLWLSENTELSGKLPVPLLTLDGKYKSEDDEAVYLLYEYIDSKTIGDNELTKDQVQKISTIISTLHSLEETIPFGTSMIKEDFVLPFLNQLEQVLCTDTVLNEELANVLVSYKKQLERAIEAVKKLAVEIEHSDPEMVLCHMDVHNWNIMEYGETLILIDWEGLKLAPVEADMIFFVDKPYFDVFMNTYMKVNKDYKINSDRLLFYRLRRKLEDLWEFIEQILFDKQDEQERNKTIILLKNELNNLNR